MTKQNQMSGMLLQCVKNESGMVLIIALLVMVILTIMGAAAMTIRNTEQGITANSEVFQHNFYSLEAVTLEGAARIENLSDTILMDPATYPAWLKLETSGVDLTQSSQWPSGLVIPQNTSLTTAATNITPPGYNPNGTAANDRIWYAAIDNGVAAGSSGTYGSSGTTAQERMFAVHGMYDVKQGVGKSYHGKMMLQLGYKKVVYSE